MSRILIFNPNSKRGTQGESPATTMLENAHAKLDTLALQIDNGMDDNCVVAKLRQMKERDEHLDPEDAVDLMNQIRDGILDANVIVAAARAQISKRPQKA